MFNFFSALWEYREELLLMFSILDFLKGGKVCGRQARENVECNLYFTVSEFAIPVKGFVN